MTTDQMKSFLAASELLNFTKAAGQLFITQSALSKQIGTIEHELGCKLFLRTNSAVNLTPEGRQLQIGLTRIYGEYMGLLSSIESIRMGQAGALSIGIQNEQLLGKGIDDILCGFAAEHKSVKISLVRMSPNDLTRSLLAGDVDIAVTLFRTGDIPKNTSYYVYAKEFMNLAVPNRLLPKTFTKEDPELFDRLLSSDIPLVMAHPESFDHTTLPFTWSVLKYEISKDEVRLEQDSGDLVNLVASGLYSTIANESHMLSLDPGVTFIRGERLGLMRKGILWMSENDNPIALQIIDRIKNEHPDIDQDIYFKF